MYNCEIKGDKKLSRSVFCGTPVGGKPQNVTDSRHPNPGMGRNRVTLTKFLHLLMILELYLELGYFLIQINIVVTVNGVTKVTNFHFWK